mmetsp:Transcript_226/g.521  ORF Transcript_226/g.521 Transcript_226/m.521 type:complete len:505 (-) Transcript_226:438-1952(-)
MGPVSNALRVAARGVSTSSLSAIGLPALATTAATPASTAPSFLASLFGGAVSTMPPMDQPLKGLFIPDAPLAPTTAPKTHITTLANGAKIASEDTQGASLAVGLYIAAGSKNETPYTVGASHLLERMAFRATTNRSSFRVTREAEVIGANMLASASREQMAYTVDCLRTNLPEAVELLADCVMNPKFAEHEVGKVAASLKAEMSELAANPTNLIMEAVHSVAYNGGHGAPLIATPAALANLNGDCLRQFVESNYTAPRVVIAAAGCSHAELVRVAEPLLSQLPAGLGAGARPSVYVGGDYRVTTDSPVTSIVLAFEFAGGWKDTKKATAMTVLNTLLGGGGSFSAGGPGKGMYSRLYTRVLNRYQWAQNCTAFHSVFDDTGLIGITAVADAQHAGDMLKVMAGEMQAVASGKIDTKELERAKAATISSIYMNLESKAVVAEDIGRQILTYGERLPPAEFIAQVKAITAEDLTAIAAAALKTAPTLCFVGDLSFAPRYEDVKAMF